VIETMTDLLEAKAALLAVKENSELPVMCTMTFEETGAARTHSAYGLIRRTGKFCARKRLL